MRACVCCVCVRVRVCVRVQPACLQHHPACGEALGTCTCCACARVCMRACVSTCSARMSTSPSLWWDPWFQSTCIACVCGACVRVCMRTRVCVRPAHLRHSAGSKALGFKEGMVRVVCGVTTVRACMCAYCVWVLCEQCMCAGVCAGNTRSAPGCSTPNLECKQGLMCASVCVRVYGSGF